MTRSSIDLRLKLNLAGLCVAALWAHAAWTETRSDAGNTLDVQRGGSSAVVTHASDTTAPLFQRQASQSLLLTPAASAAASGLTTLRQTPQSTILAPADFAQIASAVAAAPTHAPQGPDERPLWALLQAHQGAAFETQVREQQLLFPTWHVPPAMLQERERQSREAAVTAALAGASPDPVRLLAVLAQYPDEFACAHIDRLWQAAAVLAKAGKIEPAVALYRSVIPACEPAKNRLATLYKAQQVLPAAQVDALIALEAQGGQRDPASETQFARLRYDRALTALSHLPPGSAAAQQAATQLAPQIRDYQDAAAATQVGYIMLAHRQRDAAAEWFASAHRFAPEAVDPLLGTLQIELDRRHLETAQKLLAEPAVAADSRAPGLRAQLAVLRAVAFNLQHQYALSLQQLDLAEQLGTPTVQVAQLRGWDQYGAGHYLASRQLFDGLYAQSPDETNAEGLALSYNALRQYRQLHARAAQDDGAQLALYARALQSQRLYYQKRFIEAHALALSVQQAVAAAPAQPASAAAAELDAASGAAVSYAPAVENASSAAAGHANPVHGAARYTPQNLDGIDADSLAAGVDLSNHVGSAGQGKLSTIAPSLRAEWISGTAQYNLRYRQLFLYAGPLDGTLGQQVASAVRYPSSGRVDAEELQMDARDTWTTAGGHEFNWDTALGVTQGGTEPTSVTGQLTLGQITPTVNWAAYAGSAPVRDSLLSWRGTVDPYSGVTQGPVARNNVGVRLLWQVAPRWTFSANQEFDVLTGHEVQTNTAEAVDLGISYDLGLRGFDYFSVGPALHYLAYNHNLSNYSLGQGGYYSPQASFSAGAGVQWLSKEGRQFQWQGSLEAGWNATHDSASPCFPLGLPSGYPLNSSCTFAGSNDTGIYGHAQISAVLRLAPHWQLGALADANITPGRDKQFAALAFVRYLFGARSSVFSRDLPVSTRDFYLKLDDTH